MAVMGLISRIRGRKTTLTNQADKLCAEERTLEEQLVDAEAKLAEYKILPASNWPAIGIQGTPFISEYSVDRKAEAIAFVKADIAGLRTRLRLTQRLPQAKAKLEVQKNATRKERQNHGE